MSSTTRRFAMTVDTKRCVGCSACVIACKTENNVPEGCYRDWVVQETSGTSPDLQLEIRSERCNHCQHPACVTACPTGASHVNEGGAVLVSAHKCSGCKACMAACPYDARFVHPDGHIDKCTFCLHRTAGGGLPACVSVCPTGALAFGDLNDPDSPVWKLLASRAYEVRHPETGLEPNLFFLE
ncbi:MAG: 4Fe-4S dicluster domain-containing protein [Deltaproteobacteria bacterium]|nr:4Fe-4S dicluster domain-containing protein [Deltaproteobacteria bacterium]